MLTANCQTQGGNDAQNMRESSIYATGLQHILKLISFVVITKVFRGIKLPSEYTFCTSLTLYGLIVFSKSDKLPFSQIHSQRRSIFPFFPLFICLPPRLPPPPPSIFQRTRRPSISPRRSKARRWPVSESNASSYTSPPPRGGGSSLVGLGTHKKHHSWWEKNGPSNPLPGNHVYGSPCD